MLMNPPCHDHHQCKSDGTNTLAIARAYAKTTNIRLVGYVVCRTLLFKFCIDGGVYAIKKNRTNKQAHIY